MRLSTKKPTGRPMRSNHRVTDLATFQALDSLPSELRREVCFAARVWDAVDVLALYNGAARRNGHASAVGWLRASIHAGDEQDVAQFAFRHQLKHGYALPHLAAEASILRYQPPRRARASRSQRGVQPRLRSAWQGSERLLPV